MDLNELANNPDQIKQLITMLQQLLPTNGEVTDEDFKKSGISNTKNSYESKENKFLSMPEMNMHKEDSIIDKQLIKHPPVARSREFEPLNVVCRVCGRTETVSPNLVDSTTRYKCNRCSSSAG